MLRIGAAVLAMCAAGVCAAQTPVTTAQPVGDHTKHFRLTFVLTYPEGDQTPQSLVLDVPVLRDRPGMTGMSMASGSTGQTEGSITQTLQCTDVHESSTGLAAKVSFVAGSVSPAPSGSTEPRHHQLTFERQIDVLLAKPTRITEQMHRTALKPGDEALAAQLPPAAQITVTAIEM